MPTADRYVQVPGLWDVPCMQGGPKKAITAFYFSRPHKTPEQIYVISGTLQFYFLFLMKTKLLYFSKWRQFCIVDEIILDIQKKDVEVRQKITKIGSGILNTQVVKRPGPDFLHHSVGVAVCVNNYKTPEIFAPTKPNPCVVRPATNGRTRHSSSLGYLILTQPL